MGKAKETKGQAREVGGEWGCHGQWRRGEEHQPLWALEFRG